MGVAFSRKGDYDRAIELYEESLELARTHEDFSLQAKCLSNIGNVHYFKAELDEAYTCYNDALEINSRLGDQAGVGRQTMNLGLIELMRGDYQAGLDQLNRSAMIFKELGERGMFALVLINISQSRTTLSEYDNSIVAAEEALEIARDVTLPLIECDATLRLGIAHASKGDRARGREYLEVSLRVAEEAQMTRNVAHIRIALAEFYLQQNDTNVAKKYAAEAQRVAKDIGDRAAFIQAAALVASITAAEGLYFAAMKQLRQQYEDAAASGDTGLGVQIGGLLGATLLKHGRAETDREEGRQVLRAALENAQQHNLVHLGRRIEQILADDPDTTQP